MSQADFENSVKKMSDQEVSGLYHKLQNEFGRWGTKSWFTNLGVGTLFGAVIGALTAFLGSIAYDRFTSKGSPADSSQAPSKQSVTAGQMAGAAGFAVTAIAMTKELNDMSKSKQFDRLGFVAKELDRRQTEGRHESYIKER